MNQNFNQKGYVIIFALMFLFIFALVAASLLGYTTLNVKATRQSYDQDQALYLAQAGLDKAVHELNANSSYSGESNTVLGSGVFTISVSTIDSTDKRVTVTGYVPSSSNPVAKQTIKATVGVNATDISFHYGIQSGQGGFSLANTSSITGNVFSAGSVIGTGGNMIYGDVVSAGASGLVYGIHATGTAFSHMLGDASQPTTIDKDAYYVNKTNTSVTGTSYPGSPDQAVVPLPISDDQITEWENEASASTTPLCSGGEYHISSGTTTIGPLKIPCDLNITNSAIVYIKGHIWVTGNINVQQSAEVRMDPSLGASNVAIIAHNPAATSTSGIITVGNTAIFKDSGTTGSFVFLISQNNSAETGGAVAAFNLNNSASALVAYASHGLIPLAQSVSLKEVTAYKITLANSSNVKYDTGLPSSVFQTGPGGSWGYLPGSYVIQR